MIKNDKLHISFNKEEKDKLIKISKSMGLTLAAYCRLELLKSIKEEKHFMNRFKIIHHKIFTKEKVDAEEFASNYFKLYGFDDCFKFSKARGRINNTSYNELINDVVGRPDLIALKDKEICLIEVKTNRDGLRREQAKWIDKHTNFNVIIFYLEQKFISNQDINQPKQLIKENIKEVTNELKTNKEN